MKRSRFPLFLLLPVVLCGCEGETSAPLSPSDDPFDYQINTAVAYELKLSPHRWVIPAPNLPALAAPMDANNNLDIILHQGRLFLAWRTAETHFASPNTKMVVISSADMGTTWTFEHKIALGADVREPRFLAARGRLLLHFFEAGSTPLSFSPKNMWRIERTGPGVWTGKVAVGKPKEVPWNIKWRRAQGYMTSYHGLHYDFDGPGEMDVLWRASDDGLTWWPVNPNKLAVYHGGVSETAFELDEEGGLWAVTRNEDGDATGFGSHLCTAPANDLANWNCPAKSDPERYDSPWMFRHGKDIYLVARRDVGGPFDMGLSGLTIADQKKKYLIAYSARAKRTAIYKIDRQQKKVVLLQDLPSAGDTAFASVRRTGPHTYLLANYTSPLDDPDASWLKAQASPRGTQIYFMDLTFVPRK